ncbi:MAG: hypothetical protein JWM98_1818 [Thermoleophilia bacterium]|nr:hypothetical protein [Thermoleophilia bacterium]
MSAVITTMLTTAGMFLTMLLTLLGVRAALRASRNERTVRRGDLVDNAVGFNAQLLQRIEDLETKQREMELEMDALRGERGQAEREAAAWQARYEIEHDARVASEAMARELQGRIDELRNVAPAIPAVVPVPMPRAPRRATDPPPTSETDG